MPVLDSDSLSNFITPGRNYPQLKKRITEADPAFLFITIVTVEENLRGLLGRIHADRDKPKASERFQDLQDYLDRIRRLPILPFDAAARAVFDGMPAKVKRQGSNDCRIAAIAISRGKTVITSNLGDYKNIPGVVCEDWTREPSVDEVL